MVFSFLRYTTTKVGKVSRRKLSITKIEIFQLCCTSQNAADTFWPYWYVIIMRSTKATKMIGISHSMKIIQDVRYLFRKSVERSDISPGKPGPSRLSNYGGFFQTRRVALSESQNCSTVDHDVNSLLKILACFSEFIFGFGTFLW